MDLRPARQPRLRLNVPNLSGAGATTPDTAANSITGDIDIRCRFYRDNWSSGGFPMLIGKWFDNRAYALHFTDDRPLFEWSAGGVVVGLTGPRMERTTPAPVWLRGTLDVSNANGVWEAAIWRSPDGSDWRMVARAVGAAATSIDDTTAPLTVGIELNAGAFVQPLAGRVFYAEVRKGIDGPIVARFDPTKDAKPGNRSWPASTGETWSVRADSALEQW